jgi:hypothetical protein
MKHKAIEILIQKRLDRAITVEEEKLLCDHLAKCGDCRQLYERLMCNEEVQALIEYYPGHGFNDRILKSMGFRKIFAWTKTAKVFAGAWLASILFLAFSPLPGKLLNQLLTSAPACARIVTKAEIIISSLTHIIIPFARNSFDLTWPLIGLGFSIVFIYLLSKIIIPVKSKQCSGTEQAAFLTG